MKNDAVVIRSEVMSSLLYLLVVALHALQSAQLPELHLFLIK